MNSRVRHNVLIISYDFPPAKGGGVQRPAKFSRYLPENGWAVHILTASLADRPLDPFLDPGAAIITRVSGTKFDSVIRLISRLSRLKDYFTHILRKAFFEKPIDHKMSRKKTVKRIPMGEMYFGIMDTKVAWLPSGLIAGYRILNEAKIDTICATVPPATSAIIGVMLQIFSKKPLILDYRDPWTLYPDWSFDSNGAYRSDRWTQARLKLERHIERHILSSASVVSLAGGPALVDDFIECFPSVERDKYYHIPNGFDPEDFQRLPSIKNDEDRPFEIIYLGSYYWLHTPDFFLRGLRRFIDQTGTTPKALRVSFIGSFPSRSRDLVNKLNLSEYMHISPEVLYSHGLKKMVQSDALLVTLPPILSSRNWVPGKLYEYLATGKPILAVLSDGAAADLVGSTSNGIVVDPDNPDAIADAIARTLDATTRVKTYDIKSLTQRFDRRILTRQFASMLNKAIGDPIG